MRSRYTRDLLTHFLNVYIPFEMWFFFRFFHFFSSNILFWLWDSFSTHDGLFMFWFIWWENFLSLHFFFLRFSCCSSWANHKNALCSFFYMKENKGKEERRDSTAFTRFCFFFLGSVFFMNWLTFLHSSRLHSAIIFFFIALSTRSFWSHKSDVHIGVYR